jgi:hypothetical protein
MEGRSEVWTVEVLRRTSFIGSIVCAFSAMPDYVYQPFVAALCGFREN